MHRQHAFIQTLNHYPLKYSTLFQLAFTWENALLNKRDFRDNSMRLSFLSEIIYKEGGNTVNPYTVEPFI